MSEKDQQLQNEEKNWLGCELEKVGYPYNLAPQSVKDELYRCLDWYLSRGADYRTALELVLDFLEEQKSRQ